MGKPVSYTHLDVYKRQVLHRYQTTLKPMHQEFIEPSKNEADLIVPNMKPNSVAIDFISTVINNSLKKTV